MSKNRVVVVTGAAGGIGLGIAQRFARDGHPTVMLDVQEDLLESEANALRAEGAKILTRKVDVSNREQVDAAYAATRRELGPIAIVIANAGISRFTPFVDMTLNQWNEMMAINLTGVFHTVQPSLPDMIAGNWGRIITISSQAGVAGGPMQVHYSAAKGGVIGMTKAMARELAAHGITVNTIPPTLVETPRMHSSVAEGTFPLESVVQMIPIARAGTPADIAGACAYLASDDASYVTGQVLAPNGGMYM